MPTEEAVSKLPDNITGEQVFAALDCLGIDPHSVYRIQIQPYKIMVATRLEPVDEADERGLAQRRFEHEKVEFEFQIPEDRLTR